MAYRIVQEICSLNTDAMECDCWTTANTERQHIASVESYCYFFFQWERLQPLVLFVKESYSLKNIIIHLIHFEEPEKQMRRNIKMANLNISISDV